jgi:hypothetical protein
MLAWETMRGMPSETCDTSEDRAREAVHAANPRSENQRSEQTMRGDRFTLRRGELVRLSRERRCNSRAVTTCFKRTFRRMANGEFFREARALMIGPTGRGLE